MNIGNKPLLIVRQLLDRFNENEINYCHWKSNQHFDDALTGIDDLDILIDRSQYGRVMTILQELKYKHFYIPTSRAYVGIEDFIGFDYEKGSLVHLHLHSQLVVGEKHLKGFHLPIEGEVLSHRRFDKEHSVYMSSFFYELLLLILRVSMKLRCRDIIKYNIISGATKAEFEWLKANCPEFLDKLYSVDWLTVRIKKAIEDIYSGKDNWFEVHRLQHYLYVDLSPWSQGSILYNSFKRIEREAERIILEINRRYLHTKFSFTRRRPATGGLIISFLGSDGAGKSSSISAIRKWLDSFMDVRYFYMGSGDGDSSLLRFPFKVGLNVAQKVGFVKKANNFNDANLSEVKNSKLSYAKSLWVYFLSLERIRKLRDANRCRLRGFVVLTDRYPQVEFPGLCDGKKINDKKSIAGRKEDECFRLAKLCPPTLVIKMIVPPAIAVSRKPGEIDEETSRNLTERIKKIKFSDYTKCVEIDSSKKQEEVWLDIKREIWNAIG